MKHSVAVVRPANDGGTLGGPAWENDSTPSCPAGIGSAAARRSMEIESIGGWDQ